MRLYKFVASRGKYVALTADRSGRNLSSINEPWKFLTVITIAQETIPRRLFIPHPLCQRACLPPKLFQS
jgi:hypothetical protein